MALNAVHGYSGKTNPMLGRLSAPAVTPLLLVALVAPLGCSELPMISEGECGNLVVEAGEDCDGFATLGTVCRAPGSTGACHWDCTRDSPEQHACPAGFGCDADGVCRRPRADFAAVAESIPGNAESLLTGDFDGDGKDDVLGAEPAFAFGITKFRLHYFDGRAQPVRSWASAKQIATPSVRDLTGDGRADLAFSGGALGVLSGAADGSLIPHSYPSYFLLDQARMIAVSNQLIDDSTALVVLGQRVGGDFGLHRIDGPTTDLVRIVELEHGVRELCADPKTGVIFDADASDCFEIVLAFSGDREFSVVSTCRRDPETKKMRWLDPPRVRSVALEPERQLVEGVILADLNGDSHLDVMVGTDGGPHAAFGDGVELAPAVPYPISKRNPVTGEIEDVLRMPLAAADLNSDGSADFVFPEGLVFTYEDRDAGRFLVEDSHRKFGRPWTEAVVADLNGNALPDVAAISRDSLDIDVFNGSGKGVNRFAISTDRTNQNIAVGDFDGDFLSDLVFVEREEASNEPDYLSIAFGNPNGPPSAPVTAARLDGIVQIAPIRGDQDTAISDLFVSSEQVDAEGRRGTALSIFTGSGDRFLGSLIDLSSFAQAGTLESATPVMSTVGALTAPGAVDFLAVAQTQVLEGTGRRGVWMLGDLASGRAAPVELGWPFDADLGYWLAGDQEKQLLAMSTATGDLDGDGLDELVMTAPNEAGRCVVSAARLGASGLERIARLELEQVCGPGSVPKLFDADSDGSAEIFLLVGGDLRALVEVYWNGGELAAETLIDDEIAPKAFDWYRAMPAAGVELAYVTDFALYVRSATSGTRLLGAPRKVGELTQGTGVVAADVNGDGVRDLAVADRGQVRIWRALLETQ